MYKILVITFWVFLSNTALATQLTCVEKIANVINQKIVVDLNLGQRATLFTDDINSSYITEKKPGFFSLELFMASREQRLYSEGAVEKTAPLILTIWTREELIEIECTRSQ